MVVGVGLAIVGGGEGLVALVGKRRVLVVGVWQSGGTWPWLSVRRNGRNGRSCH